MNVAAALPRFLAVFALALAVPPDLAAQFITRLSPESDSAFDAYIRTAESQLDWHAHVVLDKNSTVKIVPAVPNPTVDLPGAMQQIGDQERVGHYRRHQAGESQPGH